MDSDDDLDDMDFESENAEILEHETATLKRLRGKELTVQNVDGTLRCPLSPSRKKQAYAYKDLLQHATAVANGKRGPEAAGHHSALKKFLESDLKSLASPPPERLLRVQQELLRRRNAEDMLVCPWSVVVYNIDNRRRDPTKNDIRIGLGKSELRNFFADFKPQNVHVCWGPQGHQGMSVIHFGRDLSGFKDAQALENSFLDKEHGLRDYERRLAAGNLGVEFYGWLAREDDHKGRPGFQGEEIGRYLRSYGNLKDMEMVGDEMKRIHDQQVRHLTETVNEKNKESANLKTQMEIIRRNAEAERRQLEESHKLELESVRIKARISEEEYNRATAETTGALERKEAELRQLDKDLREKESNLSSAAEKNLLHTHMMENQHLREMLSEQQGLLKQKHADKVKLVQKHEEETRKLVENAQKAALQLAKKQKTEMEIEQLHTMVETEKLFDKLTINQDDKQESKKVEELEKRLADLASSQEYDQDTISSLLKKEREATDEIADGRKMAARVMQYINTVEKDDGAKEAVQTALDRKFGKKQTTKVGIKMVGEIDDKPWSNTVQRKSKNGVDWALKITEELSRWGTRIRDSEFQPFKNVEIGNDKWEQQIDHSNPELSALKKEFGEDVYKSVTTALMEIEEYNASGRYPIPLAWNLNGDRKATLKEVLQYLESVVKALVSPTLPRKKSRI